jgi:hypothetical protein
MGREAPYINALDESQLFHSTNASNKSQSFDSMNAFDE